MRKTPRYGRNPAGNSTRRTRRPPCRSVGEDPGIAGMAHRATQRATSGRPTPSGRQRADAGTQTGEPICAIAPVRDGQNAQSSRHKPRGYTEKHQQQPHTERTGRHREDCTERASTSRRHCVTHTGPRKKQGAVTGLGYLDRDAVIPCNTGRPGGRSSCL